MNIAEILEANSTLCMDSPEDRRTLARALRSGLSVTLREYARGGVSDPAYDNCAGAREDGVVRAADFINEMSDRGT